MLSGINGGLKNIIAAVIVSITCSAITIAVYHVYFSDRMIVLDIAGFISSQKDGYAGGKISSGKLVDNINSLVSGMGAIKKDRVYILKPAASIEEQENRDDTYTGDDQKE